MMSERAANWPLILAAKVEEWRARPMVWGSVDCCQFCADVAQALTTGGPDHRAMFPPYSTREEADAIIANEGGMHALLTRALGESKPVAWAMRGDVILADFGDGLAPGVCVGVMSCTTGPRGLVFIPTAQAIRAWSVGDAGGPSNEEAPPPPPPRSAD